MTQNDETQSDEIQSDETDHNEDLPDDRPMPGDGTYPNARPDDRPMPGGGKRDNASEDDASEDDASEEKADDDEETPPGPDAEPVYNDRDKLDFDPDEGFYTGTAVTGDTEIPGEHERVDDVPVEDDDSSDDSKDSDDESA